MRGLGVVLVPNDLASAVASLQDFAGRMNAVVLQESTSSPSQIFSASDLAAYQTAWSIALPAALPYLDPTDAGTVQSGGTSDPFASTTPLPNAIAAVQAVLAAVPATTGAFPWLLTGIVAVTAVVGVFVIRHYEKSLR